MNSSKEIVKHSKKLASTPGATIGKVTRQNVDHGPAPRSEDASSMDGSNPSKRDIKVAIANGTEISTETTAASLSARHQLLRSENAGIASG